MKTKLQAAINEWVLVFVLRVGTVNSWGWFVSALFSSAGVCSFLDQCSVQFVKFLTQTHLALESKTGHMFFNTNHLKMGCISNSIVSWKLANTVISFSNKLQKKYWSKHQKHLEPIHLGLILFNIHKTPILALSYHSIPHAGLWQVGQWEIICFLEWEEMGRH